MTTNSNLGILVVGHGSRRREANDDVREVANRIAELGDCPLVEPSFLEIEHPNISEGIARLVQRGAQEIIVHPYFLSPGRHTRGDIPTAVQAAASDYPQIRFRISEPLSAHPLVISAALERIREAIGARPTQHNRRPTSAKPATVYLVGAGPGDPGLLTVKARELISSCDVLIYDYLVNPDILALVPSGVERIYAGKVGGGRQTPQSEINSHLIEHAKRGRRVVRLKGGDPFLFGRGAEEAEALHAAGISFEIVPGVSSALAVPAYAGIPLTHRRFSSSVTIISGASAGSGTYCRDIAPSEQTLVILMGVKHLTEIAADLMDRGYAKDTPVAVIRWGSYEGQQTLIGTLETIGKLVQEQTLRAPAVIVVGEVVKLRDRLQWFEETMKGSTWQEELTMASL